MIDEVYDFGSRLRRLRESLNLTQEEVGKRIGVTKGTINKYENNTTLPPVDKLEAMAILYRTSLDYLRNLDNRSNIIIDDLPIFQQELIRSVVNSLKLELQTYDRKNKKSD